MGTSPLPSVEELVTQAVTTLRLTEDGRRLTNVWATSLIFASQTTEVSLPELRKYRAQGGTWYGIRTGRWLSVSDCGLGVFEGRLMIRVRRVESNIAVRLLVGLAASLVGGGQSHSARYFALNEYGDLVTSDIAHIYNYDPQASRETVARAMSRVLTKSN